MNMFSPGTRVCAKIRAIGGWKGRGTVMRNYAEIGVVVIRMDDPPSRRSSGDAFRAKDEALFCPHELAILHRRREIL
jgi:hypothetical protein